MGDGRDGGDIGDATARPRRPSPLDRAGSVPLAPWLARLERAEAAQAVRSWGRRPVAPVAVVIATRPRRGSLVAAVGSVLAQTAGDLAVIVVDDGGGLPPLPADPRLHAYTPSRPSALAGVARNIGIGASASRLLAFLDDDHLWPVDHLERAIAAHAGGAELSYVIGPGAGPRELHPIVAGTVVVRRSRRVRFGRRPRSGRPTVRPDVALARRLSRRLVVAPLPSPPRTVTVRYPPT